MDIISQVCVRNGEIIDKIHPDGISLFSVTPTIDVDEGEVMYFSGSSRTQRIQYLFDEQIGNEDFTIYFRIRHFSGEWFLGSSDNGTAQNSLTILFRGGNVLLYQDNSTFASKAITQGSGWKSLFISRQDGILYMGSSDQMYANVSADRHIKLITPSTCIGNMFSGHNRILYYPMGMYLKEFVVVRGKALWTDSFTPPRLQGI